LLLSECNSAQLNISWPFLSSLLGGCNRKATANPLKSYDKNGQEMFNWSELHSERSNFRPSFMYKSNNNPSINFLSLALTCIKVVKNCKIETFKFIFLHHKWPESSKSFYFFSLNKIILGAPFFGVDIFWQLQFLKHFIY
jgi:hypothetical protein